MTWVGESENWAQNAAAMVHRGYESLTTINQKRIEMQIFHIYKLFFF